MSDQKSNSIHCVGCEDGLPPLSEADITAHLQTLPGWNYDTSLKRLTKVFQFKGFLKTMAFVNAVAWIAHQEKHHPDLEISFNTCTVHYQTHAVDDVTENDIICARLVEGLTSSPPT